MEAEVGETSILFYFTTPQASKSIEEVKMTIDKAIEILDEPGIPESGEALDNHYKARWLGIEAMKAWKEMRREWRRPSSMLLPGETKD